VESPEIRPEPEEAERAAILAALAAEQAERAGESRGSPWAESLSPAHADDESQP